MCCGSGKTCPQKKKSFLQEGSLGKPEAREGTKEQSCPLKSGQTEAKGVCSFRKVEISFGVWKLITFGVNGGKKGL